VSTLECNKRVTAPTPMVYYHLRVFGKEGLWENCATSTILSASLPKASGQEDRVISVTAIGPITKLATLFVQSWGHCLECRQVSVTPDGRSIVNSDWDLVPCQKNQELSSPAVNGKVIIFSVKQCVHYEEMFRMVRRYLVTMGDSCWPHTLRRGV